MPFSARNYWHRENTGNFISVRVLQTTFSYKLETGFMVIFNAQSISNCGHKLNFFFNMNIAN